MSGYLAGEIKTSSLLSLGIMTPVEIPTPFKVD